MGIVSSVFLLIISNGLVEVIYEIMYDDVIISDVGMFFFLVSLFYSFIGTIVAFLITLFKKKKGNIFSVGRQEIEGMSMKKLPIWNRTLLTFAYLLLPTALMCALRYTFDYFYGIIPILFLAATYGINILSVIFWFKRRPCGFFALISGFILTPFLMFIYEFNLDSEYFTYLYSVLSLIYYSLPFVLVSTIIYRANRTRERKKEAAK